MHIVCRLASSRPGLVVLRMQRLSLTSMSPLLSVLVACSLARAGGNRQTRPNLVELAQLFDHTLILCFNASCEPHLAEAAAGWRLWPSLMRDRISIVDGSLIDVRLGLQNRSRKEHFLKVSQTYAYLAREYLSRSESMLILEGDYSEVTADGKLAATRHLPAVAESAESWLGSVRSFLHDESWTALRLGYDLEQIGPSSGRQWMSTLTQCKRKCRCEVSDRVPWICAVPALGPESSEPACDILATTAIAFHRRARRALEAYGRAQRLKLMDGTDLKALAIDSYVAHTFGTLHYVVPMVAVQNQTHTRRKMSQGIRRLIRMGPEHRSTNAQHWAQHCVHGASTSRAAAWTQSTRANATLPSVGASPDDAYEAIPIGAMSVEDRIAFRHLRARTYFASVTDYYAAARHQTGRKRLHPTELARFEPNRHVFDAFEPEWECTKREMVPYRWGDGHKWMCDPARRRGSDCLIYSFGSNGEDSWERAMAAAHAECELHTFDPTLGAEGTRRMVERSRAYGAVFHALGLSGADRAPKGQKLRLPTNESAGQYLTLRSIMRLLGHTGRRIDFLKVDIEGSEWQVFLGAEEASAPSEGIFAACAAGSLRLDQLLIELHTDLHKTTVASDFDRAERFFRAADRCGLKIFSKEANVYACPAAWNCAGTIFEYSLVAPHSVSGSGTRSISQPS